MKTILDVFERYSFGHVTLIGALSTLGISAVSIQIDNASLLEPLYLFPIVLVSWYGGKTSGLTLAVFSIVLLLISNIIVNDSSILSFSYFFYLALRFIAFYSIAVLVIDFRKVHNSEADLANKDHLTGLLNTRSFSIELANEILRSIRYEHNFSLAYLDIDNFKIINDTLGHQAGDVLLIKVANCLTSNLRKTDIVARLGGDEFSVIFPETGQEEVKTAFDKTIRELEKIGKNVTFSVGVITFEKLPKDIKEAIDMADQLMYSVKTSKKNDVAFRVFKSKA